MNIDERPRKTIQHFNSIEFQHSLIIHSNFKLNKTIIWAPLRERRWDRNDPVGPLLYWVYSRVFRRSSVLPSQSVSSKQCGKDITWRYKRHFALKDTQKKINIFLSWKFGIWVSRSRYGKYAGWVEVLSVNFRRILRDNLEQKCKL
jgi:hypothetical protein